MSGLNPSVSVDESSFADRVYAVGFYYLSFSVVVMQRSFAKCQWRYRYHRKSSALLRTVAVYERGSCAAQNRPIGSIERVHCTTNATAILTTLTYTRPLDFGKLLINFTCDEQIFYNASINVVCK